jgi:hypothetical protein
MERVEGGKSGRAFMMQVRSEAHYRLILELAQWG